ncbi:MAG: PQQ-binding-like beta-propeller repeat protein [Planctomycetales bacterium]|nr:PQQ-binding-like beta-propeller repeat protein [Planctomycetales bacterium]
MKYLILLAVASLNLFAVLSFGDNWNQFRGPTGDGHSTTENLPTTWSESENVAWKVEIHGRGWSSPVVWGDQVWMTTATEDGKQMFAVCVDPATGETIHDILVFENKSPRFRHPTNSYASPTPIIEEGRVYVHFGSYGTACLDTHSGGVIWQRRDIECNHWRGPGASPIIHDGKLIVSYDGYDKQFVMAFDKTSGDTVWKTDRNIDYGTDDGDRKKAYCTSQIVRVGERNILVSPSAVETIAYDPKDGKEIWRVRHGGMNACSRPVFGHGLVYVVIGDAGPTICAISPDGTGNVTDSNIAWTMERGGPKRPSLLLHEDHLYMVTDDGIAQCVDAKTGKPSWKERLGGNFRSSPILSDGNIYCFDLDGVCTVFQANPNEFIQVAKNELENGCQASPAVTGESMIVRTTRHLYCIRKQ